MSEDNQAPAIITDHAFRAAWPLWGKCEVCGMAEASHLEAETPYTPTAPRAQKEADGS